VFVSVLIAFLCMLTNNKVWVTILGQCGSKSGFLCKFYIGSQEETKNMGPRELAWRARLRHGELPGTKPMIFGRLRKLGPFLDISKCFLWCVWLPLSHKNLLKHQLDWINMVFMKFGLKISWQWVACESCCWPGLIFSLLAFWSLNVINLALIGKNKTSKHSFKVENKVAPQRKQNTNDVKRSRKDSFQSLDCLYLL